eukprot:SAG31_NODE_40436_length_280_cov_25.828729_1_plen_31_part_01
MIFGAQPIILATSQAFLLAQVAGGKLTTARS